MLKGGTAEGKRDEDLLVGVDGGNGEAKEGERGVQKGEVL